MIRGHLLIAAALVVAAFPAAVSAQATALYAGRTTEIAEVLEDPNDLWVPVEELRRVNDFELKPEGACLEEICVPVRQDEDGPLFVNRGERAFFNVTELADRLGQAVAHDPEHRVFSLGEVPQVVAGRFGAASAPDFELLDRRGEPFRLSQLRGKKVLLVTWASW